MDAAKVKDDEDIDFPNNILLDKGEMTRDALAQLLLCYIGTAADIIEFFDSFKVTISLILQSINPFSGPKGEHRQGALPGRDVYLVLVTHAVYYYCPGIEGKCRAK